MKNERPYCVAKQCDHIVKYETNLGYIDRPRCMANRDFKCPKADEFLTRCTRCNDVFEFNGSYLCPKCRGVV